jgi:DNA-binding protein Fis
MIRSVKRLEYKGVFNFSQGEHGRTSDCLGLDRVALRKHKSIVSSEGALWCRGDAGGE